MAARNEVVDYLETYLEPGAVQDYCPNGLQVEGRESIQRLAVGVTACQALIEAAAAWRADALLVHHGIFWNSARGVRVERSLRRRLEGLLRAEINLLAYHLPLDRHPEVGNNAVLARRLGAVDVEPAFPSGGVPVGLACRLAQNVDAAEFFGRIARATGRDPLVVDGGPARLRSFGVVTGADPRSAETAARMGLDLFLTGESSEAMVHLAREEGLHFVAAGHHATERFGVQALGEHLARRFGLEQRFIEIGSPV
ncbi:MAG: Nif3-like dinuclear metal center hexameric protein [Acidobacteriota bacterium]|nr:Nif3-like dinuclear metal center hexameric protein [Acidobacteriota bacterium]MDQ7087819.1 Nif3-like dinuclear metal center hexameric protein [Acidobacteriota bacterium]